MEQFFDTIYYYTCGLYSQNLDNYLYNTVPGYVHVGLTMIVLSILITIILYYVIKPITHQMMIWFGCVLLNAIINLLVALWYTITPLINNAIDPSEKWNVLDTFGFGVANILWSFVFFIVVSLIVKWWSPAKYIPFKKF